MNQLFTVLLASAVWITPNLHARVFQAEGADLFMGVGAENIARGGAVAANTNDVYAIFWNPAGLSEIKGLELALATQADARLNHLGFLGIANTFLLEELGLKFSVAFAFIPKIYVQTEGRFYENDPVSIFSLYTLPGLSGNFDGKIDSATDDFRFAAAVSPIYDPLWSLGVSAGYINCGTTFAGETMEDPGNYKHIHTTADMISLGAGLKVYANEEWTFGLNVRNIDSKLAVNVQETNNAGTTNQFYKVSVPYDITLGADWKVDDAMQLSFDYQQLIGSYGDYDIDFRIIRTGMTMKQDSLRYHLGMLIPVKLDSDKIKKIDLPFPVLPTAGMGWSIGDLSLAFAVYAHPVMSYEKDNVSISADLSASYRF